MILEQCANLFIIHVKMIDLKTQEISKESKMIVSIFFSIFYQICKYRTGYSFIVRTVQFNLQVTKSFNFIIITNK